MRKTFLLLWLLLNVMFPPAVQSHYSTEYFQTELECIDQILSDPVVFYSLLANYNEESCQNGLEINAEEIFKLSLDMKKNSGNLGDSVGILNKKIQKNMTEPNPVQKQRKKMIIAVDNANYEEVNRNNRKSLDDGRGAKIKASQINKIRNVIKMSIQEKLEQEKKKLSIEQKSGNILSDDRKGFKSLSKAEMNINIDPITQQKIIEKTLGSSENQTFGKEKRTEGDQAGDMLFMPTWEYNPIEINEFEMDAGDLENTDIGEFTWDKPKKKHRPEHQVIERKNYIKDVQITEVKNEQKLEKTKTPPTKEFGFKPINFDFGGDSFGKNDFGNFGDFGNLDSVRDQNISMDFGFNNNFGMDHEVIDKKNNIEDIDIHAMVISKKENKSPNLEQSSESSIEISANKSEKRTSEKSKTLPSKKSSSVSNINSPSNSIDKPDFNFGKSDLSSPQNSNISNHDPNDFKKPKIDHEIIDRKNKDGSVKINERSENSRSSKSPIKNPSHNSSNNSSTLDVQEEPSKKSSEKSSEIQVIDNKSTKSKSKKSSPKTSQSHQSSPVSSNVTLDTHRVRKYRDIEDNHSMGEESTTFKEHSSISSFKPGDISNPSNTDINFGDLESGQSQTEKHDPKIRSPNHSPKIEIIDKKNKDLDVSIVSDIDEDNKSSNKNSSEESSSQVSIKEHNKIRDTENSHSSNSSSLIVKDVSNKTKTPKNSEETSSIEVVETISKKTPNPTISEKSKESSKISIIEEPDKTPKSSVKDQESEESSSVKIIDENPDNSLKNSPSSSDSEESSDDSSPKDKFNKSPDGPIINNNLHKKKKKRRNKFHGKTIIALQFVRRSERGLSSINHKSHEEKRREILLMFDLLPSCVKRAIMSCKPQSKKAIAKCESSIAGFSCNVQNMVAQLKCATDETYFNGACYKNCPEDMKDDSLICVKSMSKSRRAEIWNGDSADVLDETQEIYAGNLKVIKCEVFGSSYEALGPDVCVQKCPYGWKNLGNSCMKPARFLNQPRIVVEADDE